MKALYLKLMWLLLSKRVPYVPENQPDYMVKYYKEYAGWLDAGAPDGCGYGYSRADGLCANIYRSSSLSAHEMYLVQQGLRAQLDAADLSQVYPFGARNYIHRWDRRTQHLAPKRIAWVRAYAQVPSDKE